MKTIKLDHERAVQVLSGEKRSTWRMYDDKQLAVGDKVLFIDKVDPGNKATWITIGRGVIEKVTEKRLGSVSDEDYEGHDRYTDVDEMVAAFQVYYGSRVSANTPVKIIQFSFSPTDNGLTLPPGAVRLSEAKLYVDGGSRGNPGPSATGFLLFDMEGSVVKKEGKYLGVTTNNQAEYQALIDGLKAAIDSGVRTLHIYMDSLLVVNQMIGKYKVKNRELWPVHDAAQRYCSSFREVTFVHVPRELNRQADAEVNRVLDEHRSAETAVY